MPFPTLWLLCRSRSDERTCDEGCDGSCDEGCDAGCDESCDAGCDECSYDESCDSHCDTCTDAKCPEGMHGAQSKSRVASAPTHASLQSRRNATPLPGLLWAPFSTSCVHPLLHFRLRNREGLHERRLA